LNRKDRRRRRFGDFDVQPDVVTILSLATSSDLFDPPSQLTLNRLRMRGCTMLWDTESVAVGICPGFDDFLVWFDTETEPATAVPMTIEVIADFRVKVLPLVREHISLALALGSRYREADDEWALSVCEQFLDGRLDKQSRRLPDDRPSFLESPGVNGVKAAHSRAVTELAAFVSRHPHQPDLV